MNREQLIEAAAQALGCDGQDCRALRAFPEPCRFREDAERVLDAILPQVSTVEELEALPDESVVMDDSNGDSWSRSTADGATLWHGHGCPNPDSSSFLIEWAAPLTVVWQP